MKLAVLMETVILVSLLAGCGAFGRPEDPGASALKLGWTEVDGPQRDLPTQGALGDAAPPTAGPGEPILVNFWASWCKPCRKELPLLERLNNELGVQVVGINRDRFKKYALAAIEKTNVTYPNWGDPYGTYTVGFDDVIPVQALPSSVIMVDGKVTAVHIGTFDSWPDLRDQFVP